MYILHVYLTVTHKKSHIVNYIFNKIIYFLIFHTKNIWIKIDDIR